MAATVTIFALLPVALNPAIGPRIFQPFAITVISRIDRRQPWCRCCAPSFHIGWGNASDAA